MQTKTKKMKPKEHVRSRSDEKGNLLVWSDNDVRIMVSLKLKAESKRRRIGTINLRQKTIDIKRERKRHLFYTTQSYGFNHVLLSQTKTFEWVRLIDDKAEWKIPVKFILEKGHYMNHLKQGFELQIFIKLSEIEQFIVKKTF